MTPDFLPDRPREGDALRIAGIDYSVVRILKEDAYALTLLCQGPVGKVVLKRSRFLWFGFLRPPRFLERFLARKEISNYRRVDGISGVPRFLGEVGPDSHLHEWIEGTTLNVYEERVKDTFFDDLDRIVADVHARDLAYVDLAKDENIVVSEEGDPYLIDFQVCSDFGAARGPLAPVRRWLGRKLQREDRYHLLKHRHRYRPDQVRPGDVPRKSLSSRIWRIVVKKPYNLVTRRIPHLFLGERASRRPPKG
jgi:hypothetical protein